MTKSDPRKALGKGLTSLLPPRSHASQPPVAVAAGPAPALEVREGSVSFLPTVQLIANPNQPRREFDPTAMFELTQSVERDGIIQPIIARKTGVDEYQIIAGERRWRAAKAAGLTEVPVIVRTVNDEKVIELAIIENIQREDLNPIELALAFQNMAEQLSLTHEQIGAKTGKDRATVANTIRLLQLPKDIQDLVAAKKLSPGHARALLKLQDEKLQREVAEQSLREGWSVRQLEEFTRPSKLPEPSASKTKPEPPVVDPNVKAAIAELERVLGTRVRITEKGKHRGQIEIEYYSDEDLDRIYSQIVED